MTKRPDECVRWVMAGKTDLPEIAQWQASHDEWWFFRTDYTQRRVYKVGIGGSLDAPPDEWEDDYPAPDKGPDIGLGELVTATLSVRLGQGQMGPLSGNAFLAALAGGKRR